MKLSFVYLAALLAVPMNMLAASPAFSAVVQGDQLPGIGATGASLPLKPDQLTAEEKAAHDKLPPSSDDARRFLFVRGYLRYAQLVADKKLEPSQLPDLPARADWEGTKFFSNAERKLVDYALGLKMMSALKPNLPTPTEMVLLKAGQLTPEERKALAKLPANSDAARRFLHTRSYLRPCQKVVNGTLQPLQLPSLPERENWDRKYLSESEDKQIVDVCLAMKMMARMK